MNHTFVVDYTYKKNGALSRTRLHGSSVFHLNNARSDLAVQSYLQKRHPGCEIYIYSIDWK